MRTIPIKLPFSPTSKFQQERSKTKRWKTIAVIELAKTQTTVLTATLAITIPSPGFVIDPFDPVLKASIPKTKKNEPKNAC